MSAGPTDQEAKVEDVKDVTDEPDVETPPEPDVDSDDNANTDVDEENNEPSSAEKWKTLSRKNEKAFKDASRNLAEKEAALAAALEEVETLRFSEVRTALVRDLNIPQEYVPLLTETTPDKLKAQAELISQLAKNTAKTKQIIPTQGQNSLGKVQVSRADEVKNFLSRPRP